MDPVFEEVSYIYIYIYILGTSSPGFSDDDVICGKLAYIGVKFPTCRRLSTSQVIFAFTSPLKLKTPPSTVLAPESGLADRKTRFH
jgi:hypothetical protein